MAGAFAPGSQAGIASAMAAPPAPLEGPAPLTVERAIETTRVVIDPEARSAANPNGAVSVSPDGSRYLVRLVRGDVARNGVWLELRMGGLDSLQSASTLRTVARLFSPGHGAGIGNFGADQDSADFNALRWIDDDRVALLWSDAQGVRQAVQVRLSDGQVTFLTAHPAPVAGFDLDDRGNVLYNARSVPPVPDADALRAGFVIPPTADAYNVFRGELHGGTGADRAMNTAWFLRTATDHDARPLHIGGRAVDPSNWHRIRLAPDGRRALVSSAPQVFEAPWQRYSRPMVTASLAAARAGSSDMMVRTLQQPYVVDMESGASRPLWNALMGIADVRWSPDGRSVLLAPTFLPPEDDDAAGLDGRAAAVVDVETGHYATLPISIGWGWVNALNWIDDATIEIHERLGERARAGRPVSRFRRVDGRWQAADEAEPMQVPVRIELRQGFERPPQLFAIEAHGGTERMVLDPNPNLQREVALGRTRRVEGAMPGGGQWHGLLFHPVDAEPGRRYPLLIQSVYGDLVGDGFTLYGLGNLGPTPIAPYPGQVLANRGVAVLVLDLRAATTTDPSTSAATAARGGEEARQRMLAFEAAAEHLVAEGLVDRDRVALAGFSRNGYYVEYALTHSDFPYAAALSADNFDPSYMQTLLSGNLTAAAAANGAPPFGPGLQKWLEHAPGFNVDRVRAPLLMIEQSLGMFGVFSRWETFSRLHHLGRPVEFYVMPDAEHHGAHNTQNPGQILAVQQRAVDWFDFWLNGREREEGEAAAQYLRWRELRALLAQPQVN